MAAAWDQAQAAGTYHYTTRIVQTTLPAPTLANEGLGPTQQQIDVAGETDLPDQRMRRTLWNGGNPGGSAASAGAGGIEVKSEGGKAFGRVGAGEWQELDNPTGLLAPRGDLLTYLVAAQEPVEAGREIRAGVGLTRYTFAVDGRQLAAYLRDQTESDLRSKGKLPTGARLDLQTAYRGMDGQGELWVGDDGLPVRLTVQLSFQPAGKDRVDAEITTDFAQWGGGGGPAALLARPGGAFGGLRLPAGASRFEDSTGSGVSAQCDPSPGIHYATCPTAGSPGQMRSAPIFDGSGNWLRLLPAGPPTRIFDNDLPEFTIGSWVKPTSLKSDCQVLISKGTPREPGGGKEDFSYQYLVGIQPNSTKLQFLAGSQHFVNGAPSDCDVSVLFNLTSTSSLNLNQWNHVVAGYGRGATAGDPATATLYLNGVVDTRVSVNNGEGNYPCRLSGAINVGSDTTQGGVPLTLAG